MKSIITKKLTEKVKIFNQHTRGFNLLEMIVYVGIMALILVIIVKTLTVFIFSQREIKNIRLIENSAVVAFERMNREIRDSIGIDLNQTTLTKLVLDTLDQDDDPKKVQFFTDADQVLKIVDGDMEDFLTDSDVRVTSIAFRIVSVGTSNVIRVEMTLEAGGGQLLRSENFFTSVMIRNN